MAKNKRGIYETSYLYLDALKPILKNAELSQRFAASEASNESQAP